MADEDRIKALAGEMYRAFEGRTRDNGETFRCLRDGSPEWMSDVLMAAIEVHDWQYDAAENCLQSIEEEGEDGTPPEPDCYTRDLLTWLQMPGAVDACDEYRAEYGGDYTAEGGIVEAIRCGQAHMLSEIRANLYQALSDHADDEEPEDSDDDS